MQFRLLPLGELSHDKTAVYLIQEVDRIISESGESFDGENGPTEKVFYLRGAVHDEDFLENLHEGTGHKGKDSMMHALSQAELVEPNTKKKVEKAVNSCITCKKFGWTYLRPKTTLPKCTDINQIMTFNLKQYRARHILWIIDSFSRFSMGVFIKNKEMDMRLRYTGSQYTSDSQIQILIME